MLTQAEQDAARERTAAVLAEAGIAPTAPELDAIEVADFGLSRLDETGLEVVVYVNTERVCAKELVLFPRQLCPEHRHPPFGGTPGKEETFRCRTGVVYLYTEGEPSPQPAARLPQDGVFTVWHEIVLRLGDQHTIAPDTLHWFQAGDEGAVVSRPATSPGSRAAAAARRAGRRPANERVGGAARPGDRREGGAPAEGLRRGGRPLLARRAGYGGAADVAVGADGPPAAGHRRRQQPQRAREPADPGLRAWRPQHVVARRGLATSARGDRR